MEDIINEEKATFLVLDEKGIEVKCEVLVDFHDNESGKTYIAYTDNLFDEEKKLNIYASEVIKLEKGFQLANINDQDIIIKIQELIDGAKN